MEKKNFCSKQSWKATMVAFYQKTNGSFWNKQPASPFLQVISWYESMQVYKNMEENG